MTLSKLRVVLEASTSVFNREMKKAQTRIKTFTGGVKKLGVSMKAMASQIGRGVVKLTAIGVAVGFAAAKMFKWGSLVEETGSKFNTVFAQSRDDVSKFLDTFARKAGLSRQESQGLIATTGAIAQGMGFAVEESAKMSIAVTELAGDLSSFNNLPTEEVLQAIQSALVGERESLKRLGVVILESDVQRRALINTNKLTAKSLTQVEKATATLQLISERAGVAVGDLDRTMGSAANVAKRVRSDFVNLRDAIAVAVLPALAEMLGSMDENRDSFTRMENAILDSSGLIISWATLVKEMMGAVVSTIKEVASQVVNTAKLTVLAFEMLALAQARAFGSAMAKWPEMVELWDELQESTARLQKEFLDVGKVIVEIFHGGRENVRLMLEQYERFGVVVQDTNSNIGDSLAEVDEKFDTIREKLTGFADAFAKDFVNTLTQALRGVEKSFSNMLKGMANRLMEFAIQWAIFKTLTSAFPGSTFIADLAKGFGFGSMVSTGGISIPAGGLGAVEMPRRHLRKYGTFSGVRPGVQQAGMTVNQTINFQVSAIDSRDAARFIQEQKNSIAGVMAEATKDSTAYRRQLLGA